MKSLLLLLGALVVVFSPHAAHAGSNIPAMEPQARENCK